MFAKKYTIENCVSYNKLIFIGKSDLTFIFSWYNWPYYFSHAQGLKQILFYSLVIEGDENYRFRNKCINRVFNAFFLNYCKYK